MNFLPTPQRTFELLPTFQTWLEITMHVKSFNEGSLALFKSQSKKILIVNSYLELLLQEFSEEAQSVFVSCHG